MVGTNSSLGKTVAKDKGLTQDQLSAKIGVSYSTLAKLERGAIAAPSVFTIAEIAKVLGTTIDELVNPEGAKKLGGSFDQANEIKFIFCDVNGVLVRFFHRAFSAISNETGISVDRIETTFWHYNDAANRGEMTTQEFNSALDSTLGLEPGTIDWEAKYMESIEPITSMHKCLSELSKGMGVGLLSDNFPGFLNKMIDNGLLPDLNYGAVVESASVGSKKPDLKIYETAEKMAGVDGKNIFFIDDSRANLIAAEKHGWRVLWFDDYRPEESVKRVKEAIRNRISHSPID